MTDTSSSPAGRAGIGMDSTNLPLFQLLNVGQATHNGNWNWKDICSPFARIFYIVSGTARVDFEGSSVTLLPDHLYIIPPFVRHSYSCDGYFRLYYVHFYESSMLLTDSDAPSYDDLSYNLFEHYELPTEIEAHQYDSVMIQRLCQQWPEMALKHSNPQLYENSTTYIDTVRQKKLHPVADAMEAGGLLLMLVSRFMRGAKARPVTGDERMIKALNYVARHMNMRMDINDVAGEMCVSRNHCIRLFREAMGKTTMQYITAKKVERAQLLLVTTSLSVKDIAASLGYDDFSYFTRLFRRTVGVTPLDFRSSQ